MVALRVSTLLVAACLVALAAAAPAGFEELGNAGESCSNDEKRTDSEEGKASEDACAEACKAAKSGCVAFTYISGGVKRIFAKGRCLLASECDSTDASSASTMFGMTALGSNVQTYKKTDAQTASETDPGAPAGFKGNVPVGRTCNQKEVAPEDQTSAEACAGQCTGECPAFVFYDKPIKRQNGHGQCWVCSNAQKMRASGVSDKITVTVYIKEKGTLDNDETFVDPEKATIDPTKPLETQVPDAGGDAGDDAGGDTTPEAGTPEAGTPAAGSGDEKCAANSGADKCMQCVANPKCAPVGEIFACVAKATAEPSQIKTCPNAPGTGALPPTVTTTTTTTGTAEVQGDAEQVLKLIKKLTAETRSLLVQHLRVNGDEDGSKLAVKKEALTELETSIASSANDEASLKQQETAAAGAIQDQMTQEASLVSEIDSNLAQFQAEKAKEEAKLVAEQTSFQTLQTTSTATEQQLRSESESLQQTVTQTKIQLESGQKAVATCLSTKKDQAERVQLAQKSLDAAMATMTAMDTDIAAQKAAMADDLSDQAEMAELDDDETGEETVKHKGMAALLQKFDTQIASAKTQSTKLTQDKDGITELTGQISTTVTTTVSMVSMSMSAVSTQTSTTATATTSLTTSRFAQARAQAAKLGNHMEVAQKTFDEDMAAFDDALSKMNNVDAWCADSSGKMFTDSMSAVDKAWGYVTTELKALCTSIKAGEETDAQIDQKTTELAKTNARVKELQGKVKEDLAKIETMKTTLQTKRDAFAQDKLKYARTIQGIRTTYTQVLEEYKSVQLRTETVQTALKKDIATFTAQQTQVSTAITELKQVCDPEQNEALAKMATDLDAAAKTATAQTADLKQKLDAMNTAWNDLYMG